MDIVRIKGGLGNQMFFYALIQKLRSLGRDVKADISEKYYSVNSELAPYILEDVFPNVRLEYIDDNEFEKIDVKYKKIKENSDEFERFKKDLENRFFYVEENYGVYDEDIFKTRNCTFVGFWQTDKYFQDIRETILNDFQFNVTEEKLKQWGNEMQDYIGVHVRKKMYDGPIHKVCTEKYFRNAISYMKEHLPDKKIIFFTDEIEYVKNTYGDIDMIICEKEWFDNYQDWYDMYLMSKSAGNIISNSSFSWWGAWLNQTSNKIVVAPNRWVNTCDMSDIWCDNWVKIDVGEK